MKKLAPAKHSKKNMPRNFRRGQWVQVRSLEEIQATLDAQGKLDGLPFMPEMIKYCGQKFQVARRADRIFLDRYCYVAALKNTVFLGQLRCDGKAHDDCQMGCQLFWKQSWLKPADPPKQKKGTGPICRNGYGDRSDLPERPATNLRSVPGFAQIGPVPLASHKLDLSPFSNPNQARFTCQATELVHASKRLPWWDLRQYIHELMLGETTINELGVALLRRAKSKLLRIFSRRNHFVEGLLSQPTPTQSLNLQPGEWVEVKSLAEIKATLDANGKNRGLGFAPDQAVFCGKRYRVAGRVEKIILEWSGEMRTISNTVKLEEVTCHGRMCRSCPRNCLHLWREIWLRRVTGP